MRTNHACACYQGVTPRHNDKDKRSHMIRPFSLFSALRIGLLAVGISAWAATALAQNKQIDLEVKEVDGTSKIQFKNLPCDNQPGEKGCVQADYGNSPILMWELDKASNKIWKLVRMQFSPDGALG
jgi:hypothetical protein